VICVLLNKCSYSVGDAPAVGSEFTQRRTGLADKQTEKTEVAKVPAKKSETKRATAKKAAVKKTEVTLSVARPRARKKTEEAEVAQLAYQFWSERGRRHGNDWQDWLLAEQELKRGQSKKA